MRMQLSAAEKRLRDYLEECKYGSAYTPDTDDLRAVLNDLEATRTRLRLLVEVIETCVP